MEKHYSLIGNLIEEKARKKLCARHIPIYRACLYQNGEECVCRYEALSKTSKKLKKLASPKGVKRLFQKNYLFQKQNGICAICLKEMQHDCCDIDHIIPLSRGGGWNIENLRATHKTCNHNRGSSMDPRWFPLGVPW